MAREEKSKFMKDWFGRHAEDSFTYSDPSKRLINWDKGMTSYSKFFRGSNDNLKDSAKMLGSMFRVIGVPKSAKFKSSDKMSTGTAKDLNVQIPLSMLKDKDGKYLNADPNTVDAFYGAAIQNAALAAMQTTPEYNATIKARTVGKHTNVRDLLYSTLNTERVDAKLADRFPGYLKFIQKYKDYKYEEHYKVLPEDAPAQQRLLDLLMRMLRYPANITPEEMAEFEQPLKIMEKYLKKFGGIPKSSDDCYSMAQSLANMVYKYTEKEEEKEEEPKTGSGGEDGEDGDNESEGSGEGSASGEPSPPSKSKPKSGSSSGGMSREELDELARKMMDMVVPEKSDNDTETREAMSDFVDSMEDEKEADRNDISVDADHPIIFTKAPADKDMYLAELANIDTTKASVLHRLFARKNKDFDFAMKSMRSGRLDTNKIAEAVQNVPTIYERIGHVKTNKVCIGVLIDESGKL